MTDRSSDGPADSARHWDRWREQREGGEGLRWRDWWESPLLIHRFFKRVTGENITDEERFFKTVAEQIPWPKNPGILSLCGGTGDLERRLYRYGLVDEITILEVSETASREGKKKAAEENIPINYLIKDANAGDFGEHEYDLILASSAVHHLESMERVFEGVANALKPEGLFVMQEYTGPDRFQWEEQWLRAAQRVIRALPPDLRRGRDGRPQEGPWAPSVDEVVHQDPTEAVRSSEILPAFRKYLRPVLEREMGGAFYQMLFPLLLPNLEPGNEDHEALICRICAIEDHLLDAGYPSHFTFAAGRKSHEGQQ